ncbi:MAG: PEGA domain-containing protein [Fibrobacteres bacterium]|nr:PEGA domain-containing protein [Fibrobacterota bacterium]
MDVKVRSLGVFELIVLRPAAPTEKVDIQKLDDNIKQVIGKGVKNLCIDLSQCSTIEFPLVETLKHANKELLHIAGRLAILSSDVKVTNQLDDLGISNYLRIYQTEEEISADSKEILRQTESYYMGNLKVSDSPSLAIDLEAALKKSGLAVDSVDKGSKNASTAKEASAEGSILSKNEFDFLFGGSPSTDKSSKKREEPQRPAPVKKAPPPRVEKDEDDDLMDTVVEKTAAPQEVKVIRKEEIKVVEEPVASSAPKQEIKSGYRRPGSGQMSPPLEQKPIEPTVAEPKKRTVPLERFEAEESAIIELRQKKKMSPLVAALITGLSLVVVVLMAWGLGIIGGKGPDPAQIQPTKYKDLATTREIPKQAVPSAEKAVEATPPPAEPVKETAPAASTAEKKVKPAADVKPEYKALPKKAAAKAAPKKDKEAEELNSEIDDFLKDDPPPKPAPAPAAVKTEPVPAPKPEPKPEPKVEAAPAPKAETKPAAPAGSGSGSVFISSSPPTAEILLNGNVIGVANRAPVELPTGTHTLVLRKDNMEKTVEIQVFDGRNKPLFVKLQ